MGNCLSLNPPFPSTHKPLSPPRQSGNGNTDGPSRPDTPSTVAERSEHEASQVEKNIRTIDTNSNIQDTIDDLEEKINKCCNIHDFDRVYTSRPYQMCLKRIENSQRGQERNVWAKQWAERLSRDDKEAIILNNIRRICLRLLYAICNSTEVAESDILQVFKRERILRILYACLPMDRANALYNMYDYKTNKLGMHWYSLRDEEVLAGWRAQYGNDRMNTPTINKRLKHLFELKGLGLSSEAGLSEIMKPCRTPLAD